MVARSRPGGAEAGESLVQVVPSNAHVSLSSFAVLWSSPPKSTPVPASAPRLAEAGAGGPQEAQTFVQLVASNVHVSRRSVPIGEEPPTSTARDPSVAMVAASRKGGEE